MDDDKQGTLFDNPPAWKDVWRGMPEYEQNDLMPYQSVKVHFRSAEDRIAFAKLIGQPISNLTQFVWFPPDQRVFGRRYVSDRQYDPRYPVYIISKGRWDTRLTSRALEKIGVPYKIAVEPQEYASYAAVIDPAKILVLPFSNLGLGSIPARNWVWEHALSLGAKRHWILDDNIDGFCRLHDNAKIPVSTGQIFCAAEDFADRYLNVALCGFNYRFFAKGKQKIPPFILNTRIYSGILIDNAIEHRWRGRYNEDTDLSLRVLKSGLCTVQFNAFLSNKAATMTIKGGNTDELYQGDGRKIMAESLKEQHPDVVRVVRKWDRWQHHVNYSVFRGNKLISNPDAPEIASLDNYGMTLQSS